MWLLARSCQTLPRWATRRGALLRHIQSCSSAAVPGSVDIERYPLHKPEECRPLVERLRRKIASNGYCHLPGFLRREAVDQLVGEASGLVARGRGFRSRAAHSVFLEDAGDAGSGPGSLRAQEFSSSKVLVAMDDMGADSQLLEVYRWEPLRSLLQSVFDLPRLYHSADPLGGAYYNIFDGAFNDALGWHFDRSNFSMNLILQTTPGAGGDFQYVPDSRLLIVGMRRWEEVEEHIRGRVEVPPLFPGSLYLFAGSQSIHRVSPVTSGKRINAIFTYVENEGDRGYFRKYYGDKDVYEILPSKKKFNFSFFPTGTSDPVKDKPAGEVSRADVFAGVMNSAFAVDLDYKLRQMQ